MGGQTLRRVLIIQTAFLGDVILATGLVEKIHQHYPDTEIDFLLRKGNESLLENHPIINEVIIFNKSETKYLNLLKVIRKIRHKKYDLIANIQRYFTTGIITIFSNAAITIGFDKNPLSYFFSKKIKHDFDGYHEIERNHELIAWFTDNNPAKPRLYPQKKNLEKVARYQDNSYICIAPASVWFTKQFPVEKWLELISKITLHIQVYLIGGPDDYLLCEEICKKSKSTQVSNLCGAIDLLDTAALMGGAVLNIVNDSAPMHIASAMNAPTCAIYCSTLPALGYGPLSAESRIVEIKEHLYCRPCGIHGRKNCPEGHFRCAYDINIEEIIEMINNKIKK